MNAIIEDVNADPDIVADNVMEILSVILQKAINRGTKIVCLPEGEGISIYLLCEGWDRRPPEYKFGVSLAQTFYKKFFDCFGLCPTEAPQGCTCLLSDILPKMELDGRKVDVFITTLPLKGQKYAAFSVSSSEQNASNGGI